MNGWHEGWDDFRGQSVTCGHLRSLPVPPVPADPTSACRECVLEGSTWVELRRCLDCGHTGCCDSSPRRHATAHYHSTGHPVIANQSLGQAWGWCYVDELALTPDEQTA